MDDSKLMLLIGVVEKHFYTIETQEGLALNIFVIGSQLSLEKGWSQTFFIRTEKEEEVAMTERGCFCL